MGDPNSNPAEVAPESFDIGGVAFFLQEPSGFELVFFDSQVPQCRALSFAYNS